MNNRGLRYQKRCVKIKVLLKDFTEIKKNINYQKCFIEVNSIKNLNRKLKS